MVEYKCTCLSMDPVAQMVLAMDGTVAECRKRVGSEWVCSRPAGHDGECVACNQVSGEPNDHGDWHGVSATHPWGTFATWSEPAHGIAKIVPQIDCYGNQWEDK